MNEKMACWACLEQVDDSQLKGIEVLHLVNLYPAKRCCRQRIGRCPVRNLEGIIGHQQDVLEVEQVVLPLVVLIATGSIEAYQQVGGLTAEQGLLTKIMISHVIKADARILRVGQTEGGAQFLERRRGECIAMNHQTRRVVPLALMHQVLQVDNLRVALAVLVIAQHL